MQKKIKERFGILIRPTGRFELIQLGIDGNGPTLVDALENRFEGPIEYARNADGHAYITREGAFHEGRPRNDAATYFAGIGTYGDCVVLPKRIGRDRVIWSRTDAYKIMIRLECDWEWYCEYSANPEKYNTRPRKTVNA